MQRRFVRPDELGSVVADVFGTNRRLTALDRIDVASKKGVYRLTLDDGTTAIVYVWHPDENFWPGGADGGQFGDPCGLDAYLACKDRYGEAGVRTADTIAVDATRRHYPADIAVVEHLPNGTLEALIEDDARNAQPALEELAGFLTSMSRLRLSSHGRVADVAAGVATADQEPHQLAFGRALDNLDEAAGSVPAIAAVRDRIRATLHARLSGIEPRHSYSLVHGELGPDHVMLDRDCRPTLVDLEGTQFGDVESEHVFTRMRFADHYETLRIDGLDEARMRLYELAMYLSLVAGPMRLVDGDHSERDFMRQIAEVNTRRVLEAI